MPSVSKVVRKNIVNQLENFPLKVKSIPSVNDFILAKDDVGELPSIPIEKLLERESVPKIDDLIVKTIKNKVVLITGAGGSFGSELCRQIINYKKKKLILVEISEYSLYLINKKSPLN